MYVVHDGEGESRSRRQPFRSGADVTEANVEQQDLLNNECGHGFGQLGPGFHDAKTQGNDLG